MDNKRMKIGLVHTTNPSIGKKTTYGDQEADMVDVHFEKISKNIKWSDLFPQWIDESLPWDSLDCPEIPMPSFEEYRDLDLVVANVPCGGGKHSKTFEDVLRLQVNLVVANLLVRSVRKKNGQVFVVFIGSCGPLLEIFRCDDLLWHEDNYWIYKPDLRRLQQKVLMPVGSCQLAPPYLKPASHNPKEAYVSVIHSSEDYVCGAITLAQSIIKSNTTRDLILLVDDFISKKSLENLKSAGWKIKHIQRIHSPYAQKGTYNEWNYSKLRIWQLVEYDKLIFIDSDFIILRNTDGFFAYPQLSASGNSRHVFNSGFMLIEPSTCTFETLMKQRYRVVSYNGGDQGFLNEMFMWWHRLPTKLNFLKDFIAILDGNRDIPADAYALHYLGLKPWMCYKDYDCNWDVLENQRFGSDSAHGIWWRIYDEMPAELRSHCELSPQMEANVRMYREMARNGSYPDGHWKIKITDSRSHFSHDLTNTYFPYE
ncbi:putative UDP-glucuronate:xylan alpha-glucuronosyltransferase 5 [Primulina huaijiensis]|uniref:putative UDP-glucuronate:xylan alpha-glucuronosyltransferase 5 n=1 Tax=Primulina huaijiensis TaxID=1492673 RepID=UPI003CC785A2